MESDGEIDNDTTVAPSPLPTHLPAAPEDQESKAVVWWIISFVSLFQTLHCISDRAISWLLLFLCALMKYLKSFSPRIEQICASLPSSIYLRDKFVRAACGTDPTDFQKYVVCPSCHSLYNYENCYQRVGSHIHIKMCNNSKYSKRCNTLLLKKIVSKSKTVKVYPIKIYCYCSLITTLQHFLLRPGFADLCESTRDLVSMTVDTLNDIYNGQIWKEFLEKDGKAFCLILTSTDLH